MLSVPAVPKANSTMKKAVVFDLFETLVTEWGHEKYTKKKMSNDLQCPSEDFARCWEMLHEQQYLGQISFQDSLRYVCNELGIPVDEERIRYVTAHRMKTKGACFDHVHPGIYPMLKALRKQGYKLAILSNCSQEEVALLLNSTLAPLVDHLILSYETGLCKPQPEIYQLAAAKLGVTCEDCVFIGDGGSRELYGAVQVGMQPYRAMWYIRQIPSPIKEQPEFTVLETPMDVLNVLCHIESK